MCKSSCHHMFIVDSDDVGIIMNSGRPLTHIPWLPIRGGYSAELHGNPDSHIHKSQGGTGAGNHEY